MSTDAALPRLLGPYELDRLLGRGGMGAVYRARTAGGGLVAMKLIRADMLGDSDVRRRFAREARAAARLQHPNIALLLDFGTWSGETGIVMELVDGIPLTSWRQFAPDGESLMAVLSDILSALAHAHARGVVHRDLKPENVMVSFTAEGRPTAKVMDFGVAHFREERIEGIDANVLIGTPAYMSPEQALRATDVSPSADLYAVGVMLHEFITGSLPFDAKSTAGQLFAHLHNPIPPLVARQSYRLSGPLEAVVHRLLAKKPADRYLFAIDALRALQECAVTGLPLTGSFEIVDATDADGRERQTQLRRPSPTLVPTPALASGTAPFALFALRDPPFRGRDADLHELKALANDAVLTGAPRVAIVLGEAGVGKSRLVSMLVEQLEENGDMQAWRSQCEDGTDEVLRDALRRGLGTSALPMADTSLRLRELLERQNASDTWEHATLLEFVGPPEARAASQRLKHENARWALIERVLLRAAAERPVALVLEDVHLSDGAALRFVDYMLTSGGKRPPCLIVLTCRPGGTALDSPAAQALEQLRRRNDDSVRVLQLGRLDLREMQQLVRDAVPIDPAIASGIAMRAGGNPLLAVETIRHLVDTGRLENSASAPTVEEVLLDLPVGLGEILTRRLHEAARSPEADANTMQAWMRLAVVGTSLDEALVERLLCERGRLGASSKNAALIAGVATGILREDSPGVLRFENQLVRDALTAMARREGVLRNYHASAAAALETPDASGAVPAGEVARHHAAAGAREAAEHWYIVEAEAAARRKSFEQALTAWLAAVELARDGGAAGAATLERALLGAAEAQLHLGRFDGALALVDESRHSAKQAGRRSAEATRLLAEISARQGNLREARALYGAAAAAFASDNNTLRQAWAEVGLAGVELRDGQIALAEQVLLRARERFAAHNDIHGDATVLLLLGRAALDTGLELEAAEFARKGQRRHVALGDRHGAAMCILLEGEVALAQGRASDASEAFDRARGELLAAGDRHGAARATYMLGVVAEAGGRETRARSLFREALRTFESLGDMQYGSLSRLALARLDAETGAWEAAEPAIDRVLERDAEERNDDAQFVTLLVETARTAILGERNALARRLLETAAHKLGRVAHATALYDRVDEVQYLLHELQENSRLDGSDDVDNVTPDDDPS